jgi:hypothetical protein
LTLDYYDYDYDDEVIFYFIYWILSLLVSIKILFIYCFVNLFWLFSTYYSTLFYYYFDYFSFISSWKTDVVATPYNKIITNSDNPTLSNSFLYN